MAKGMPQREVNKPTWTWRRITGTMMVVSLFLVVVGASWVLWKPREFYWSGRRIGVSAQKLAPGLFEDEGLFVRSGWDGPTGHFTHGDIYGVKIGGALLRLDITYDPIAEV